MERLGDAHFRRAFAAAMGNRGPDEMCTEFYRVPERTSNFEKAAQALAREYDGAELVTDTAVDNVRTGTPLAVQLMGGEPDKLAYVVRLLASRRRLAQVVGLDETDAQSPPPPPPRIDLNCGCPANLVTGKGAGSSLLRTPEVLYDIVRAMVDAANETAHADYTDEEWATCASSFAPRHGAEFDDVAIADMAVRLLGERPRVPVSVKMRSGFDDTSLFEENLLAAQEAGASFVTLHPRTKAEGYRPAANWSLIARARDVLSIPVVGNGDVTSLADARRLIAETGCDGVMIGRGAAIDPFVFHRIRQGLAGIHDDECGDAEEAEALVSMVDEHVKSIASRQKSPDCKRAHIARVSRLKLLGKFMLFKSPTFRDALLRRQSSAFSADDFASQFATILRTEWVGSGFDRTSVRVSSFSGDHGAAGGPPRP